MMMTQRTSWQLLTSPTGAYEELVAETIRKVRQRFGIFHQPSEDAWMGMEELAKVLAAAVLGKAEKAYYLSTLDAGVGKTTVLSCFLHTIREKMPNHKRASALIMLETGQNIASLIGDMKALGDLPDEFFAVLTSPATAAKIAEEGIVLPDTEIDEAPVLITTQEMLRRRIRGKKLADVEEFYFHGQPRTLRVWDETAIPAIPVTIDRDALRLLTSALSGRYIKADWRPHTQALEGFCDEVSMFKTTDQRAQMKVVVPDIGEFLGSNWNELNGKVEGMFKSIEDISAAQDALFGLKICAGQEATVKVEARGAGNAAKVVISHAECFPEDFAPAVVLDASGIIKATYPLWSEYRDNLIVLQAGKTGGRKRYDRVTFHVATGSSGKNAFGVKNVALRRKNLKMFSDAIREYLQNTPAKLLVIHPKDDEKPFGVGHVWEDLQDELGTLSEDQQARLQHVTWGGGHRALNCFRDCNVVFCMGLYWLPAYVVEAECRAAMGTHDPVDGSLVGQARVAETRQHLLQAINRGHARVCDGVHAGACEVYMLASETSRLTTEEGLQELFPGARLVPWGQKYVKKARDTSGPTRRMLEAIGVISDMLKEGKEKVTVEAVEKKGFLSEPFRRMRKDDRFSAACREAGVAYVRDFGARPCFMTVEAYREKKVGENAKLLPDWPAAA